MAKKTKGDPTGQRVNRSKTARLLKARLLKAYRKIVADFNALTYTKKSEQVITNKALTFYQYDASPDDLEILSLSIQSHLNGELETVADKMPKDWWYKKEIELSYRQGSLEELNELNQALKESNIGSSVIASLPIQEIPVSFVLFSPSYLDGLREAQIRNYGLIKSLNADSAKQVYQVLQSGIQSGKSTADIKREIKERFQVSVSSAKRIADTEVNRAYNDARLSAVKMVKTESGIEAAVMHISSLLPTTRDEHANRHGNVYTPDQQLRWWNEGSNRINCKCTTRSVLMKNGKVVQSELQKKVKDMRFTENG